MITSNSQFLTFYDYHAWKNMITCQDNQKGQYYVVLAEVDTGMVLRPDGTKNLTENIPFEVFETLESAEQYADEKVMLLPSVECNIYNDQSQRIKIITAK